MQGLRDDSFCSLISSGNILGAKMQTIPWKGITLKGKVVLL
jgi:hypothetical protein